ncbi:alpha/beta hydrolase [Streptomyces sp. NPDC001233]|uniref:alpha/beta hydrolase n=1 Tax=unclassified Streptomyces TaxID=2593676 RepID=UPI003330B6E0
MPCAFWPGRGAPLGALKAPPSTPRPLVINGTNDPRTGLSGARTVAQRLDAKLVTFQGRTHVATQNGVECAQRTAARYLLTASTRSQRCPPLSLPR